MNASPGSDRRIGTSEHVFRSPSNTQETDFCFISDVINIERNLRYTDVAMSQLSYYYAFTFCVCNCDIFNVDKSDPHLVLGREIWWYTKYE